MVNLQDWDLPVPDWVILAWLGLLEAIILVGMAVFIISLFEQSDFMSTLPLPRSRGILLGLVVVFTVVFTAFRMNDKSIIGMVR